MFNEQQQQVIEETDRNMLLMAAAGTGKTTTIAERIRSILQQGKAVAAEILCITFTNRACREMDEKINGKDKKNENPVQVRTIHGFCYDVIRKEYYMKYGKIADFVIFDEEDTRELLSELSHGGLDLSLLQNFIQLVKHERCRQGFFSEDGLQDYKKTVQEIFLSEPARIEKLYSRKNRAFPELWRQYLQEDGAALVARYDEALEKQNGLDFDALILQVFRLFRKKRIRRRWREKYRYLIIDEVQDTSFFEYQILASLFKGNHMLLAGDFFQTIYAWRGSEPFLILADFKKKYNPLLISFAENYRSSQWLLEAAFSCLQNLFGKKVEEFYQQPLQSNIRCDERAKIPYREFLLPEEEASAIFSAIQRLQRETPEISAAVLTRNNMYNQYLSEYFHILNEELPTEKQLPFMLVEQFKFFRRQEIKDLLAALRILLRPADQSSLKRYLNRFAAGVGGQTIARIEDAAKKGCGLLLSDYMDPVVQKNGTDPYAWLIAAWEEGNIVIFDVETTGLAAAEDEIIQLAAVRLGPKGCETASFARFLQAEKSVGDSEAVHGFSDEFLKTAGEDPRIVLQDFVGFAAGAVIAGHNVGFDIGMLRAQAGRLGLDLQNFAADYFDTLDLCRRFYPGLASYKLLALAENFSLPPRKAHDALEDVRMTADLFSCLATGRLLAGKHDREFLLQRYLPLFRETSEKFTGLRKRMNELTVCEIVAKAVVDLGIKDFYVRHQQVDRIRYLREFYLLVRNMDMEEENTGTALQEILKKAALSTTEMDRWLDKKRRIPVLTIHQAKGTEFDCVFLAGLSDGIFPSQQTLDSGDIEEEKRLFYVAITRAKKFLYLSRSRKYKGKVLEESRLLQAFPVDVLETVKETPLF